MLGLSFSYPSLCAPTKLHFLLSMTILFLAIEHAKANFEQACAVGIRLSTQEQVDNFWNGWGCEVVPGLVVEGPDITNLFGLCKLKAINISLIIQNNPQLHTLEGLDNLRRVGWEVIICNNSSLTSLEGLTSLESVPTRGRFGYRDSGKLTICDNPVLRDLRGLDSLRYAHGLEILNNDNLQTLHGLDALQKIGTGKIPSSAFYRRHLGSLWDLTGVNVSGNPSLISMEGLQSVDSIGGSILIAENPNLHSLEGLEIQSLGGGLSLVNNDELVDISALHTLRVVGGTILGPDFSHLYLLYGAIIIAENEKLSNLTGLDSLRQIQLPRPEHQREIGGDIYIVDNPNLVDIHGIAGISSELRGMFIRGNDNLSNCQIETVCRFAKKVGRDHMGYPWDKFHLYIDDNTGDCFSLPVAFDLCVGSDPLSDLVIYPNPVSSIFDLNDWALVDKIVIYSLDGERMTIREPRGPVDISHLRSGMYIVAVHSTEGFRNIKILKQ
ncbi:MAG: T9SS type A sorting domain-containing protein [Bacteroidota bacterium]